MVARVVSVTNWTVEDIMHNMSMPQLVLLFDRYPKHETQPDIDNMQGATTYKLQGMGGKLEG